jgi:hypothetical protein
MSEQNLEPMPEPLLVAMSDASSLPIYHVNALNLRAGIDEFFFTLGIVPPPDRSEIPAIKEAGHIEAQPIFRFAVSRDTMEKFLSLMADQFEEQTRAVERFRGSKQQTGEKEAEVNE